MPHSSLSDFQKEVLNRISDDFEAAHTITGDISRDAGKEVSEADVLAALLSLVEAGLASAFQYNEVTQTYEQMDGSQAASLAEPWFFARR